MSKTKKKDLITRERIDEYLKHNISSNSDKSNQEQQLLRLLQEMQITLDDPTFEDSIEVSRKGVGEGKQRGENIIRFQYIKIYIDYGKVPIKLEKMMLMMLLIAMILLKTQ
jgi:hypothetical protein